MDAKSGLFSWAPGESDGPSTNSFVVTATDNGWPRRTTTQLVTLVVREVNLPPLPGPIPTLFTYAGSQSSVALSAVDPDIPPNAVSFSLDMNAPPDAIIDGSNGLVTWTPPDGVAGSCVTVGVVVTDNGIPPLSSTGAVIFNVASPDTLLAAGMGQAGEIRWMAVSGTTYCVEFTDAMSGEPWQQITNFNAQTNDIISIIAPDATNAQQFYRLRVTP
jgi:hypothetical protein